MNDAEANSLLNQSRMGAIKTSEMRLADTQAEHSEIVERCWKKRISL